MFETVHFELSANQTQSSVQHRAHLWVQWQAMHTVVGLQTPHVEDDTEQLPLQILVQ